MRFFQAFRQARLKRGDTIRSAAECLGVSNSTISYWESGYCEPHGSNRVAANFYIRGSTNDIEGYEVLYNGYLYGKDARPCPFCTDDGIYVTEVTGGTWAAGCTTCGAVGPEAGTREEAAELWQSRE